MRALTRVPFIAVFEVPAQQPFPGYFFFRTPPPVPPPNGTHMPETPALNNISASGECGVTVRDAGIREETQASVDPVRRGPYDHSAVDRGFPVSKRVRALQPGKNI